MAKEVDYDLEECVCTCDECGYEEYVDDTDYHNINAELREMGWIIKQNKYGEWVEFCSIECSKAYAKENGEDWFIYE